MLAFAFVLFSLLLLTEPSVTSSSFSPSEDCRDKLGMSDPNKIKTSQIVAQPEGDEDKFRLIEGNELRETSNNGLSNHMVITVDLLEIYNITGIMFLGYGSNRKDIYFEFLLSYKYDSIRNIRKSTELQYRKVLFLNNKYQEHYIRQAIEARYVYIYIYVPDDDGIYFQFELLGCKPNVTTTVIPETTETSPSTEVTTPVKFPCNDILNWTLNDYVSEEESFAKQQSIDFDPPGLYKVESVTLTLNEEVIPRMGMCTDIKISWFLEYTFDGECFAENRSLFYYRIEDPRLCEKMIISINNYENIQYSLEIIGCYNESRTTYTPTPTTEESTSPSSPTTATSFTTENCTSRPTFQIPANYFQIDNCTNLDPIVNLHECVGKCNTYSSYPENGMAQYTKTCECCIPYEYNTINVNLYCYENETNVPYTIEEPSKCECS